MKTHKSSFSNTDDNGNVLYAGMISNIRIISHKDIYPDRFNDNFIDIRIP